MSILDACQRVPQGRHGDYAPQSLRVLQQAKEHFTVAAPGAVLSDGGKRAAPGDYRSAAHAEFVSSRHTRSDTELSMS